MPSSKRSKKTTEQKQLLVLAGFLVVLLASWWRLLLSDQIPFDGNTLRFSYPTWMIGKNLLQSLHLLWDPYRNMGQPFLADPQSLALYPLSWISPIVDFLTYTRLFVVFHAMLASLFMGLLVKKLFKDDEAAAFAGVAFGLGSLMLARVTLHHHFAALAWVPVTLYFLAMGQSRGLGIALALQWVAGYPTFFILNCGTLIVFAGIFFKSKKTWKVLARGFFIGLALSSVQWIPFIDMMRQSDRPLFLTATEAVSYSVSFDRLWKSLLLPGFLQMNIVDVFGTDPAIVSGYLGPIVTILFLCGIIKGKRPLRWVAAFSAVAFLLTLGAAWPFYSQIPGITIFRYPGNWLLPATIAMLVVAAAGLSFIRSPVIKKIAFGLFLLDLLCYAWPQKTPWGKETFFTDPLPLAAGLDPLPTNGRIFHDAAITHGMHQWQMTRKEDWLTMKGILSPSYAASFGIKETHSYHQLPSSRLVQFVDRLEQAPANSALLGLASIGTIVHLSSASVSKSMPDLADFVIQRSSNPVTRVFSSAPQKPVISQDKAGSIVVEAEGPATIVVSEAGASGWVAKIDGVRSPLQFYENTFLSTEIGPGTHRVQFVYRPMVFFVGLAISLFTIVGLLIRRRK